jgi:HlyD family secretion protein
MESVTSVRRRWRAWMLLPALALVALALWAWSTVSGPRVGVREVLRRDLVQSVVASGRLQTPNRVELGAQVTGTVVQVPVAAGQKVSAGQLLVQLQDAEATALERQARLAVGQAQGRLRQLRELQAPVAEQALRQARATLDTARATHSRNEDLFRQGFIGEAALEESRKALELASAQRVSARHQWETAQPAGSDYAMAEAALAQAEAALEAAQARRRYTRIVAPRDGVLIDRDVEVGDVVQPGKTLMVLSPEGPPQIVVDIDERHLPVLALGQAALASADAAPNQRFQARLAYINPGVNAQTGAVQVKLDVPEAPAFLRQDMTLSVDIEIARRAQALAVALDAVHEADSAAPWVLVVVDGRAQRRAVRLGLRGAGFAEVLEGLQGGERVILAAETGVREGARVRIAVPASAH